MSRHEEHGLRPGREVIRLSWTSSQGKTQTSLFLYDTSAGWMEHFLKNDGKTVKRDRVKWDGIEHVSTDNGD